jgi:hypothetical protein
LYFLGFEYSEDPQGGGCFDALASVQPAQLAAVRAEIAEVLDWAEQNFPGQGAPLDEGGEWDVDLQETTEPPWQVLSLSISGSAQFCAAFRQRFVPDGGP